MHIFLFIVIENLQLERVISDSGPSANSAPSKLEGPTCYVLVPNQKSPGARTLHTTPLLVQNKLVYHTHGFIICTICKSAIPWNYLQSHLNMEWILQPIYAPGAKTAHTMELRPNHKRFVDKDLGDLIKKEINGLIENPKFLVSRPWIKMPKICSAVEGVAIFEGGYCSECEESVYMGPERTKCGCGNPLEPSTVQCIAYHWKECQQWFQVPTSTDLPTNHQSAIGLPAATARQLRGSKVQMLASYSTPEASLPLNPVLSRLGLDTFCQMMWKHPTFPSIWKGITQWPQAKVKLEKLAFRTAIEDYNKLLTSNPSFKQLVFSNRRYVVIIPILNELNLITYLYQLSWNSPSSSPFQNCSSCLYKIRGWPTLVLYSFCKTCCGIHRNILSPHIRSKGKTSPTL